MTTDINASSEGEHKVYHTLAEFYPFYLSQHQDPTCRRLHYIGSTLVLLIAGYALVTQKWLLLLLLPIAGYGFAWLGHFKYEHNKPATFTYPVYSLICDWIMLKDAIFNPGRISRAGER